MHLREQEVFGRMFSFADTSDRLVCLISQPRHRLCPGVKLNNMFGTYECPDFPMTEKLYGIKPRQRIPGAIFNRYLINFAKNTSSNGARSRRTEKLIVASGMTSEPNFPKYPEAETFNAPLFHAKDFCKQAPTITSGKNAIVIRGAKSAFHAAYAVVQRSTKVDLVIRPNERPWSGFHMNMSRLSKHGSRSYCTYAAWHALARALGETKMASQESVISCIAQLWVAGLWTTPGKS